MLRRLYVHNFRCLDNFELNLADQSSCLLIGPNGAGKSSIGAALEVLQRLGRGTNRVDDIVYIQDMRRIGEPIRFEIDVEISGHNYSYSLALAIPQHDIEFIVFEEKLTVNGETEYHRLAEPHLTSTKTDLANSVDWGSAALPILRRSSAISEAHRLRSWLAGLLVLRPVPSEIDGSSAQHTRYPDPQVKQLGAWFTGLLTSKPSAYGLIVDNLRGVMPDLREILNQEFASNTRNLEFQFGSASEDLTVNFSQLSDGEKCFVVFALVAAANKVNGPLLCFWDEPDNFIAPSEVGPMMLALRKAFESGGQFIATSHNPETIRKFPDESIFYMYRNSHLEPAQKRRLDDLRKARDLKGDFVNALIRGDLP